MRNITVAVDDETYTRARAAAAQRDTSVSALVKAYLEQLASLETETERLKRHEREIRRRITAFSASDGHSREDLYTRSKSPGFSNPDSAIVAAARTLGCDRLYTEDLNHGQMVEGLAIMDPFR